MKNTESLNQFLAVKRDLENKLSEKGISTEELPDLVKLANEYTSLEEKLDDLRCKQFEQEAKQILYYLNLAEEGNRNMVVSVALRRFAEHVGRSIAPPSVDEEQIKRVVDSIPAVEDLFK